MPNPDTTPRMTIAKAKSRPPEIRSGASSATSRWASEPPKKARISANRIRRSNSSKAIFVCSGVLLFARCHESTRRLSHPRRVVIVPNALFGTLPRSTPPLWAIHAAVAMPHSSDLLSPEVPSAVCDATQITSKPTAGCGRRSGRASITPVWVFSRATPRAAPRAPRSGARRSLASPCGRCGRPCHRAGRSCSRRPCRARAGGCPGPANRSPLAS